MSAKFTAVETRILRLLSDGMPHTKEEVHSCLSDELGPLKNISVQLSNLRKKLRPMGQDVVCYFWKGTSVRYRQVILMPSNNE